MSYYAPTADEIAALTARGWHVDKDDARRRWWYPPEWGNAYTYREAVREQARRDKRRQVPA